MEEIRADERMMEITIKNGFGVEMTIRIGEDASLPDVLESLSGLLYTAGYPIQTFPSCYREEAERIEMQLGYDKED